MDKYKKHSVSTAVQAGITKAYEASGAAIGPLASAYPALAPLLIFVYCYFGARLAYSQEELNDFTKYLISIQDSLGIDYESKEFREGVLVQLEAYFKLRIEDKRLVAQEIFTKFCGSPNKPEFPLERYNDTLEKISVQGLQYLVFLQNEILPLKAKAIEKEYEGGNYPPTPGKSKEWWIRHLQKTKPVSDYVSEWLKYVYPQTVDVSVVGVGREGYRQEEVQIKADDLSDLAIEMEQLGIMRTMSPSGGLVWSGGGSGGGYALSPYGTKFIEFIRSAEVDQISMHSRSGTLSEEL